MIVVNGTEYSLYLRSDLGCGLILCGILCRDSHDKGVSVLCPAVSQELFADLEIGHLGKNRIYFYVPVLLVRLVACVIDCEEDILADLIAANGTSISSVD